MNNHDFNIINQLVQEQKSLWRIENHYTNEARNEEETAFWNRVRQQKTELVTELKNMAKDCLE